MDGQTPKLLANVSSPAPDNKNMETMDMDELRKALTEPLKEIIKLKECAEQPAIGKLRNHIYEYLLVNSYLATSQSIAHSKETELRSPSQQYGLSPNILRVCHQIYNEALVVLYCSNTFIADFAENLVMPVLRTQEFSRFSKTLGRPVMKPASFNIPALKKIALSPPLSIQVSLNLQIVLRKENTSKFHLFEDEVRPLGLLRNIKTFKVYRIPMKDFETCACDRTNEVAHNMEESLKLVVEGNSPVIISTTCTRILKLIATHWNTAYQIWSTRGSLAFLVAVTYSSKPDVEKS
ncbi:hypothetical protein IFR05_002987 [Cadophora sp. M221]|nr:hypothetical protein IFR05_002987 [Cadophora sp. M221]